MAAAAVAALGIENGPRTRSSGSAPTAHTSSRSPPGSAAGTTPSSSRRSTGVDLNGLAIDAALGNELVLKQHKPVVGGAVTRFLVAPPGLLEQVEVPELPEGVERVRIYREPGFVFTPLRRGSDRAGAVLATGASREEALARAKRMARAIRFRVTAELAQPAH